MFSISFAFINFIYQFALAGGGGSDSGGDAGGIVGGLLDIIAIVILFIIASIVGYIRLLKKRKKQQRAAEAVFVSARSDDVWNRDYIINSAMNMFYQYQKDWEEINFESMKTYMTEEYFKHASLMLGVLTQMNRVNQVREITIKSAIIEDALDVVDDNMDAVCVEFKFLAKDVLLQGGSRILNSPKVNVTEYWHFARAGKQWKLAAITQATEDPSKLHADIRTFAHQNGMYYSPDYGRLLIPERGQLFSGSAFLNSDINNHVVGIWPPNHLIQLYTYSQKLAVAYYIIAQINLPKSYGGIIVERRDRASGEKPKHYVDVSLEWGDFNRRYKVFATRADQVTSFELLNPAFMAWLYDKNIKVNIEVVDNVVYLYSKVSKKENRYPEMMEILRRSYGELKL